MSPTKNSSTPTQLSNKQLQDRIEDLEFENDRLERSAERAEADLKRRAERAEEDLKRRAERAEEDERHALRHIERMRKRRDESSTAPDEESAKIIADLEAKLQLNTNQATEERIQAATEKRELEDRLKTLSEQLHQSKCNYQELLRNFMAARATIAKQAEIADNSFSLASEMRSIQTPDATCMEQFRQVPEQVKSPVRRDEHSSHDHASSSRLTDLKPSASGFVQESQPKYEPGQALGLSEQQIDLLNAFMTSVATHCVILGAPGTGKSLLAKALVYHFLQHGEQVACVSMGISSFKDSRNAILDDYPASLSHKVILSLTETDLKSFVNIESEGPNTVDGGSSTDEEDDCETQASAETSKSRSPLETTDLLFLPLRSLADDTNDLRFNASCVVIDDASQMTSREFIKLKEYFPRMTLLFVFADKSLVGPQPSRSQLSDPENCGSLPYMWHLTEDPEVFIGYLETQYRMCPAIASYPLRRFDEAQHLTEIAGGQDTRSIVRAISCDKDHLNKPQGNGSEYWFRDVVHGTLHGRTNHASADAVKDEVKIFLEAGARPEQIVVLSWSRAQVGLVASKVRSIGPLNGRSGLGLQVEIAFVEDFGHRESDIIVADLVMADERDDHDDYEIQSGNAKANKACKKRKEVMVSARNPLNFRIGLTRAKYGMVVIGQGTWLMRWPRYKYAALEEARHYAELVRDAWRRKVYVRDTAHRDTHPDAIKALRDLSSIEVAKRAEEADKAKLRFFHGLINAGPAISRVSAYLPTAVIPAQQTTSKDEKRNTVQAQALTILETEEAQWQEQHGENRIEPRPAKVNETQVPESWEDEA